MRVRLSEEKKIRGKVEKERARKLSKGYRNQRCYLLQLYDPSLGIPVGILLVRTEVVLNNILRDLIELNLYPLILTQPVYVPEDFWLKYRKETKDRDRLIKEYGLLKDSSIYRYETVVIDIDSPFDKVYPVWKELKERIGIKVGYQVYKTKSGRFRAYIYLSDGTKDLKRAKELLAIIYAFFEKKELKADPTFVHRLNHPVFYENFPLYSYELIEEVEGDNKFFKLYRSVKRLQKEFSLYEFNGKNLTEWIWDKKPPIKKQKKRGRILKAPAFIRKLEEEILDVLELWKRRVAALARNRSSYRYIYVIQPAVGWAKYLNLPEDKVTEFLVELLGEEKRRDVEKAWRYARELVFEVPDRIEWFKKTREEWEEIALSRLRKEGEVYRQELLKKDFYNQKWLCDLVMEGLEKKGLVVSDFVRCGRGRPRKVYRLVEIEELPIRKAVGCEVVYQIGLELNGYFRDKQNFVARECNNLAKLNNSPPGRAMGGGWLLKGEFFACGGKEVSSMDGGNEGLSYPLEERMVVGDVSGGGGFNVDEIFYSLLQRSRVVFDLVELSGKVRRRVWLLSYSFPTRVLVLSDGSVSFQDVARINFPARSAVKFFKEILPELPPSEGFSFAEGKRFFIYPYASSWEKWEFLRHYPYFLVLHRSGLPRGKRSRKIHEYSIVYKLLLSAFTVFNPYPGDLISEGEPTDSHEAGVWREGAKEVTKLILQEFRDRKVKKLLVTLALKDGREITGVLNRFKLSGFYYVLSNPDDEREKIFVMKHAVDDFWVEE